MRRTVGYAGMMFAVGGFLSFLPGCASTPRLWFRADITQQQFSQDNYACAQEANAAGKGSWSFGPLWWVLWQQSDARSGARKMYELCMQAKGYELRESPDRQATASSSPTAAQFERVVSEQKGFFATVRAAHEREWSQPVACGGTGSFVSLNNYILALAPWAEEAGLRRGDRITRIGDDSTATLPEVLDALTHVPEGGPLRIAVVRNSQVKTFALPCRRLAHEQTMALLKELFAAGAAGDWGTCLTTAERWTLLQGFHPAFVAGLEYRCKVGQNRSAGKVTDASEAQLLYEAHRLALEEAQFEPDGTAKRRGAVLADIAYLRQRGFSSLADDLEAQLTRASHPSTSEEHPASTMRVVPVAAR